MIRRIVFCALVALVLLPAAALAEVNRDVLLTADGTLFTIERVWASEMPSVATASNSFLLLTTRKGADVKQQVIPWSRWPGTHGNPALAYDAASRRLFIFWQHSPNLTSTRLVFSGIDDTGSWTEATEVAPAAMRRCSNLRIGVTRRSETLDVYGEKTLVSDLNVHAIWWDASPSGELARYAMVTIEKGQVSNIQVQDAAAFIDKKNDKVFPVDVNFNVELLRHPTFFESPTQDTVDVVFGDVATNSFHRITLKPVLNARIRIPIGVHDQGFGPPAFSRPMGVSSDSVGAINGSADSMILYFRDDSAMHYTILRRGTWSALRQINLDEAVTADVAVTAMRRMLSAE